MPQVKCTVCGGVSQLEVGNPATWAGRHSSVLSPGICARCFGGLEPGAKVQVRFLEPSAPLRSARTRVGAKGTVTRILETTPDGARDVYDVTFDADGVEWEETLARAELYRIL